MTDLTPETLAEWRNAASICAGAPPHTQQLGRAVLVLLDALAAEKDAREEWEATANRYAAQFEAEYERAEQVRETADRLRRANDQLVDDRADLRVQVVELEGARDDLHARISNFAGRHAAALSLASRDPRDPDFEADWVHLCEPVREANRAVTEKGAGDA